MFKITLHFHTVFYLIFHIQQYVIYKNHFPIQKKIVTVFQYSENLDESSGSLSNI
jgi:hypothetical protein